MHTALKKFKGLTIIGHFGKTWAGKSRDVVRSIVFKFLQCEQRFRIALFS